MRKRAPGKRPSSWASKWRRLELYRRDGCRCAYCGIDLATLFTWRRRTLDHRRPVVLGGGSDDANVVTACKRCNDRKQDMGEDAFRRLLAAEAAQLAFAGVVTP